MAGEPLALACAAMTPINQTTSYHSLLRHAEDSIVARRPGLRPAMNIGDAGPDASTRLTVAAIHAQTLLSCGSA